MREADVIVQGLRERSVYPGKRGLDWKYDDPAGPGVETLRPIRDEIEDRIETPIAPIDATRAPA